MSVDYSGHPCETINAVLVDGELQITGSCGKPSVGYLFPARYHCADHDPFVEDKLWPRCPHCDETLVAFHRGSRT